MIKLREAETQGRVHGYLCHISKHQKKGEEKLPPTPIAGRTLTSMKVLSGSSSRGFTSMGPATEAITVVKPDLKVAEPSALRRRVSEAAIAIIVVVVVEWYWWYDDVQRLKFAWEPLQPVSS